MIEIKSPTHTIRMFATKLSQWDMFRVVLYTGFLGDIKKVPRFFKVSHGHSCVTDLSKCMDDIMLEMKSNTRNEIRRAFKEGCVFDTTDDIDGFVSFYNSFCDSKGLNDHTSRCRMSKYKNLLLTKVSCNGLLLAMHANLLDEASKTALLVYSCSQRLDDGVDRKLIGWANRFLHYKDLEYLKSKGFVHYDWSGVCTDKNDSRYSIGQFKLSFGGKLIDSYSLMSPLYAILERLHSVVKRII